MSQDNNNIIVKSTLPRTASAEDKLNEIINQLQQKYQHRTIYTLSEMKKENKGVSFDTVAKWLKEVNGATLSDYLIGKGILTSPQYFDIAEKDISVEDIKGKKCCAFSYNGTIGTHMQDDMAKCGAIIVSPDSNEIDYVCGAGLKQVSKVPQDSRKDLYFLFDRRDKGELNFEVVAYDFRYKVEEYLKNCMLTQEERNALGISTYDQPQEIIYDYGYTIINNIKLEDIPQYDATKHYWSLNYFYGWYEASGGEVKFPLDHYCAEDCEDPENIIKRNFAVFSDLCNRIEDKQIQSYISRKAHTLISESKKSMILASLGYISDFDGCWCIVLSAGKGDAFTIKLQKVKMLSLWDDCDYDLEKLEENGIPATLCAIIEDHANDYAFRGMPGYIWIDNTSGVIPQGAFANDPSIKYIEMSDNINKIDFNAFANCTNLESVRIGSAVEEINAGAFSNCCNLKNVIIPASVRSIGHRCFKDCSSLGEVLFESESSCEIIEMSAFSGCTSLESITIPRCIKTIKEEAFCDCSSLINVCFEDQSSCNVICSRAFSGCVSLSNINIPNSTLIYDNMIINCIEGSKADEMTKKERGQEDCSKYAEKSVIISEGDKYEEELRKIREDNERRVREDQEREAREETERKDRDEETLRIAREATSSNALDEAYRKAQEDAERRKREVAERNALEAERKAREEAERKKREEIERICREAEERRLRAEAERKAQEEAERLARESERKAREEAERKAREEEERKAKEEAERKEREKERRKAAREEAKRKAREEEERKAREEAERLEQERICAERRAKKLCQHCGGKFKGLFTKKCSNCGMKKDY